MEFYRCLLSDSDMGHKLFLSRVLLKHFFFGIINFGFSNPSFGQEEEDIFKGELSKIYNEVKSPESEAFEKYGSPNVSLYSGTPQVSIPLHTFER